MVRDGLGDELERNTVEGAQTGADLQLTLDASLQAETEKVLAGIGRKYTPAGATAIVMDPRSSEILAMASWPSFDPAKPADATPAELRNMATGFTYEPGSTFKAFTVAGALEERLVTPETMFDLPPEIQVADRTIADAEERGYVTLSVAQILAQSSNVGAIKIGLELGADKFDHWVRRFGFGSPTGVSVSRRGARNRDPGQGLLGLDDGQPADRPGSLGYPDADGRRLLGDRRRAASCGRRRLIESEGGVKTPVDAGKRVISRKDSADLREMLKGVLAPGGTASEVSVPGYTLAGKTGTAQKVVDGTYSDTQFVASFVGFAPADNPKLLVAVVVDDPKGDYYGGTVAAPAFGEIAKFALPYLGIPPNQG